MVASWQRVRVPFLERAVLAELSARWGVDEGEALRRCLRQAAVRELTTEERPDPEQREEEARHA